MRIDLALKYLCLVKSRSLARTLCQNGRVLVGGRPVRPSHRVGPGDRVTVHFRARDVTVELVEEPRKQLSRSAAVDYYRPVATPPGDTSSERDASGLDDV